MHADDVKVKRDLEASLAQLLKDQKKEEEAMLSSADAVLQQKIKDRNHELRKQQRELAEVRKLPVGRGEEGWAGIRAEFI